MRLKDVVLVSGCALAYQSTVAHAYLDPGTGSLILQGIIGGILASWAVIQLNFARLRSFFRFTKKKRAKSDNFLEK